VQPLAQALKTGFAQQVPQASGLATMGSARRRPVAIILLAVAAAGLTRLPALFDLPLAGYAAIALVLVLGIAAAPPLTQAVFGALAP
jgi:putative ABC transport system permease protein